MTDAVARAHYGVEEFGCAGLLSVTGRLQARTLANGLTGTMQAPG
jgi:hypothetical protein